MLVVDWVLKSFNVFPCSLVWLVWEFRNLMLAMRNYLIIDYVGIHSWLVFHGGLFELNLLQRFLLLNFACALLLSVINSRDYLFFLHYMGTIYMLWSIKWLSLFVLEIISIVLVNHLDVLVCLQLLLLVHFWLSLNDIILIYRSLIFVHLTEEIIII